MKYSEYAMLLAPDRHLPSWEERLKARQESLSGVPSDSCLVELPAVKWPRKIFRSRLIVAAMCLAENGQCSACLMLLQNA